MNKRYLLSLDYELTMAENATGNANSEDAR